MDIRFLDCCKPLVMNVRMLFWSGSCTAPETTIKENKTKKSGVDPLQNTPTRGASEESENTKAAASLPQSKTH